MNTGRRRAMWLDRYADAIMWTCLTGMTLALTALIAAAVLIGP